MVDGYMIHDRVPAPGAELHVQFIQFHTLYLLTDSEKPTVF